ncbi:MAG: hypothetical protein IAX21_11255 [Candidatus Bathyarchaeota archaeon]|nr:MAG: hypothetical protein NUK63_06350 [Candidatus Bathyarchaeum tardum]WNZ29188.1 MAG: hypothetical protein IAX21_11255 [Candidatus Bathyarchaeota archaeon]
MGKIDHQRGQQLTLRCGKCKRPLGIFYVQKSVTCKPKIEVLKGSVHKTCKGTMKIHAICKCGEKTVFENNSETPTKQGWKRLNQ